MHYTQDPYMGSRLPSLNSIKNCPCTCYGWCPNRYEFPICIVVALCFPEALLSLDILYLWVQAAVASMKYLIVYFALF